MALLSAQKLSFTYPGLAQASLDQVSFEVEEGDFIVLCGKSGSGKSTLLSLIKHDTAPYGRLQGQILYQGKDVRDLDFEQRAREIGFVFQNPDQQMVMGDVLSELIFGMENLGLDQAEMRKRLAEISTYFNLNDLFHRESQDLSGGQKQIVNLASILLLHPKVLLLDEPTSQLDPIAAKEFLSMVKQLNDELGMTILIADHRLENIFPMADQVLYLDQGKLTHYPSAHDMLADVDQTGTMYDYLPTASRLYLSMKEKPEKNKVPLTVKEGRQWIMQEKIHLKDLAEKQGPKTGNLHLLRAEAIDFQYDRHLDLVLDHLFFELQKGKTQALMGANGSGKTTLLKVLSGQLKTQHGKIRLHKGKKWSDLQVSYIPQNPGLLFSEDSLHESFRDLGQDRVDQLMKDFGMVQYKNRHPFDLSGGEQQKAGLIMGLARPADLYLLDEPTKGLDPDGKRVLGKYLNELADQGRTLVMVSHDVEFIADFADQCALLFDGRITVNEPTQQFFSNNLYYTTAMHRISNQSKVPATITIEEALRRWEPTSD